MEGFEESKLKIETAAISIDFDDELTLDKKADRNFSRKLVIIIVILIKRLFLYVFPVIYRNNMMILFTQYKADELVKIVGYLIRCVT